MGEVDDLLSDVSRTLNLNVSRVRMYCARIGSSFTVKKGYLISDLW